MAAYGEPPQSPLAILALNNEICDIMKCKLRLAMNRQYFRLQINGELNKFHGHSASEIVSQ